MLLIVCLLTYSTHIHATLSVLLNLAARLSWLRADANLLLLHGHLLHLDGLSLHLTRRLRGLKAANISGCEVDWLLR